MRFVPPFPRRPTGPPRRAGGFRALRHHGFRIYFGGMLIRGVAVWMQLVSLPWFVVELGASPAELGLVAGLMFLPTLVVSPLSGVLADRVDRATVLVLTQLGASVQAGALFLVAISGSGSVPVAAVLALAFGVLTAIELPVRQAYLTELVPPEDVTSAVSLHATAWNTTRFLGPGLAGILIAAVGVAASFLLSSLIALAVAGSVVLMERFRMHRRARPRSGVGVRAALAEGARFAIGDPRIRWGLLFVTAGGIFGIQTFQTLAPLYVSEGLGLGGGAYGAFMAIWGLGAVVAAYVITMFADGDRRPWLMAGAGGMAVLLVALALVDLIPVAYLLVGVLGFAQIALVQNALITVQGAAPDALRGRIMGFYTTIFQGTSPFGAFFAGVMAEVVGVRGAMLVGAGALASIVVVGGLAIRAHRTAEPATGAEP